MFDRYALRYHLKKYIENTARKVHLCITYFSTKKCVGFKNACSIAKTKLRLILCTLLLMTYHISFCDDLECLYAKLKNMHQQHVNCLINAWDFCKSFDTAFY